MRSSTILVARPRESISIKHVSIVCRLLQPHADISCFIYMPSSLRSQEVVAFPENEPYEFRLMPGHAIRLETNGSFFIDNKRCSGEAFMGADLC